MASFTKATDPKTEELKRLLGKSAGVGGNAIARGGTPKSGGGGGGGKIPTDPIEQFQYFQNQANKANQSRLNDAIGSLNNAQSSVSGTYASINELLAGIGQAERDRIEESRRQMQSSLQQNLVGRGIANTSALDNAVRSTYDDAGRANRELTETLTGQRINALMSQAGSQQHQGEAMANLLGSVNQVGPDPAMFSQLVRDKAAAEAANQKTTINTGLSQNARAGLDAFGQPFDLFGGGGGGGLQGSGAGFSGGGFSTSQPAGGTAGGSAGTVNRIYRNPNGQAPTSGPSLTPAGGIAFLGNKGAVATTPGAPKTNCPDGVSDPKCGCQKGKRFLANVGCF